MELIYLLEHLLVHSYLIQGEFEEFHEKKAAINLIANHFQFHVSPSSSSNGSCSLEMKFFQNKGIPFQKSTDEVGVKIDIRH